MMVCMAGNWVDAKEQTKQKSILLMVYSIQYTVYTVRRACGTKNEARCTEWKSFCASMFSVMENQIDKITKQCRVWNFFPPDSTI